jgi:hypothetical protein
LAGKAVLSFSDRDSARAARALAGDDFVFRCLVCGRVHTAGKVLQWKRCAERLALEWGLVALSLAQLRLLPPLLRVEECFDMDPELPDFLALEPGLKQAYEQIQDARPHQSAQALGPWCELLSLTLPEAESAIKAAWEEHWEKVGAWAGQIGRLLKPFLRDLPGGVHPPEVPDAHSRLWGVLVGPVFQCVAVPEGPVRYGRHAAAFAFRISVKEGVLYQAVRFSGLGARLVVACPEACVKKGLGRDAAWLLAAAEAGIAGA